MSFFNEMGKKITDVSQETIQKTKNMADTVKLNSAISDEEQKIKDACEQIGRIYMKKYCHDQDPDMEAYVNGILASEQKIAEYNRAVQSLKGMVICTKCGVMVDKDASFCPFCGNPMPVKEKPVVVGFCPVCGAGVTAGQKFCISCGNLIVVAGETLVQTMQHSPDPEEKSIDAGLQDNELTGEQ